ncbi:MAG: hypothetical protein R3B84_21325 [Zavarzinella sp.]
MISDIALGASYGILLSIFVYIWIAFSANQKRHSHHDQSPTKRSNIFQAAMFALIFVSSLFGTMFIGWLLFGKQSVGISLLIGYLMPFIALGIYLQRTNGWDRFFSS